MNPATILGLHTDVPSRCHAQEDIAEMLLGALHMPDSRRARAIKTVMGKAGVSFRHVSVDPDFFDSPKSTQQRNDQYMVEALPLATRTIDRGLIQAGYTAQDIDGLFVVSCTGFNTPGLDLLLARDLGMTPSLRRTCILGMGCYGAFPGMKRAWESVASGANRLALVLSIELCTVHLQLEDSVESVISASLFADGAGMMLIGAGEGDGPSLIDAETYCDYKTLDHMTFNVTDNGFRMYLSSYVPDVLAANIEGFVAKLLDRHDLTIGDVAHWAIHPGSQRIVEYIQERLGLADEQVQPSLDILRENGNMSSATVMFVLQRIMRDCAPKRGDYGVMMAFGPGLTMESILIRW